MGWPFNKQQGISDQQPVTAGDRKGPLQKPVCSVLTAVLTEWVRVLGSGHCLRALTWLVFFSQVAGIAFTSPLSPSVFFMGSVLFPHRAPFIASRPWIMAPNSWEEPRQGRAARHTWACPSSIL